MPEYHMPKPPKNNSTWGFFYALFTFLVVVIFVVICTNKLREIKSRERNITIDLPEEINQAQKGDTLIVLSVKNDTITIGYK